MREMWIIKLRIMLEDNSGLLLTSGFSFVVSFSYDNIICTKIED